MIVDHLFSDLAASEVATQLSFWLLDLLYCHDRDILR